MQKMTKANNRPQGLQKFYLDLRNSYNKYSEACSSQFNRFAKWLPPKAFTAILVFIPTVLYAIRAKQYIEMPQLYAEDGAIWLADAYNHGFRSILSPYNGFAHTAERLYALFVTLFPLKYAPFLFDFGGFLIFVLMCYYLFSKRLNIFTNNYQKLFLAFSLGLMANFNEFFFNFSNSIFLLGIIGLCIYVARPSAFKLIRSLEKVSFIIICLTLPFAWFYLLIIAYEWLLLKKRNWFYLMASGAGSIIQLFAHEFTKYPRPDIQLSVLATSRYTVLEIYNQIITPGLRFARMDTSITIAFHQFLIILIFCLLLALIFLVVTIRYATRSFRYLAFFLLCFTAAALKGPLVGGNLSSPNILKFMDTAQFGNRYFFYGILGVFIMLALLSSTYIKRSARYGFLIVFMCFSLITSITIPALTLDTLLV
jgi:hypothetical protein